MLINLKLPNALRFHLFGGLLGPTAIGCGTSGTGMQDFSYANLKVAQSSHSSFFSKASYGNQPFRLQNFNHGAQMTVTCGHQRGGFDGGKFVRSAIAAGVFHERQRTVVGDEVVSEKIFRRGEAFAEQSPQATATDFTACAGESVDGALGVLAGGFADRGIDSNPIARGGDFTKGYTGLCHPEGAWVHAEENGFLFCGSGKPEVLLMRGPCVVERIVHERHGVGKSQLIARGAQVAGCGGDVFQNAHGASVKPVQAQT